MPVDPLFPYASHPPPCDAPTGQIDRSRVRYPRGMLDQIDFRPISRPARRAPVVQAQPPPPRSGPSCPVCSVPGTARPGDGVRCPICQRRIS
jgi:hypothetical protein